MDSQENQIKTLLDALDMIPNCPECKTRLRFGDQECPRCGHDVDDILRAWAIKALDALGLSDSR
jgi:predicted amidophosphoribosyltransferase